MRTLRLFVGLTAIGSMIAGAATGCSSDSDNPGGGGTDGGGGSETSVGTDSGNPVGDGSVGDSAVAPVIAITASDGNVYLGQIAILDASGSTVTPAGQLAYTWTIDSVPPGSTVATASIINAGSAKPSFTPDVVGDYKLKLVAAVGTTTSEKVVTIKAFEAQSVFIYTEGDGGVLAKSGLRATATVSDAGTKDLSCHVTDGGSYDNNAGLAGTFASDFWEAPPGGDSKAVYNQEQRGADAAVMSQLLAVSTSSTCAAAPTLLDEIAPAGGQLWFPRISPNGTRVSYVRKVTGADRVMSVGLDGTDKRELGAYAARADGGPAEDASVPGAQTQIQSPRWMSATKVGWLQFTTDKAWQVVVADDVAGSVASIYMTCTSPTTNDKPVNFAFTADGSIVVGQRLLLGDSASTLGARDLVVYKPNATTKACDFVRNLTNQAADGGTKFSAVSNFSISPDGLQLAYIATDPNFDAGGTTQSSLWTVAVDGTTPPAPVPGAPDRGAIANLGPRWLAGGALLAWPQEQRSVDGGATASQALVVSPAGGGTTRVIANTKGADKGVFAMGTGGTCTIAAAGGSGLAGLGAIGAMVSLMIRRRRRSN